MKKNNRNLLLLALVIVAAISNTVPNTHAETTYSSVYTGITLGHGCKDLTPNQSESEDSFNWFCGTRSGYSVYFSGADARSDLSFKSDRNVIDPVLFLQKISIFGGFVNVSGNKLEWRYAKDSITRKKTLIGMIFRVSGTNLDFDGNFVKQERLVVVNLKAKDDDSVFSAALTNTEARSILDQETIQPLPVSK